MTSNLNRAIDIIMLQHHALRMIAHDLIATDKPECISTETIACLADTIAIVDALLFEAKRLAAQAAAEKN